MEVINNWWIHVVAPRYGESCVIVIGAQGDAPAYIRGSSRNRCGYKRRESDAAAGHLLARTWESFVIGFSLRCGGARQGGVRRDAVDPHEYEMRPGNARRRRRRERPDVASHTFTLTVLYMRKAPRTITRNKTGLAARTTCNKSFLSLNHAISRAAGFVRADIVGYIDWKRDRIFLSFFLPFFFISTFSEFGRKYWTSYTPFGHWMEMWTLFER